MAADACPFCNKRAHLRRILSTSDLSVILCSSCGLARTDPAPSLTDDEYIEDKVNLADEYVSRRSLFETFNRELLAFIIKVHGLSQPGDRSLDVGCSIGLLVEAMRAAGYAAEGVDLNRRAIGFGRLQGVQGLQEGILDNRFGDSDYALLTMSHVLEHVEDIPALLAQVYRVLQPGGTYVLSQPVFRGLVPRVWRSRWYGWQLNQHFWHFDENSLRRILAVNNFEIVAIDHNSMHYEWPKSGLRSRAINTAITATARIGERIAMGDKLHIAAKPVKSAMFNIAIKAKQLPRMSAQPERTQDI